MTVSPTTETPQKSEEVCHVPIGVLGCRLLGHWNGTGGSAVLHAVTFDLWQTLIVDTPDGLQQARADRVRGMAAVLAREGHAANDAAVDRAYDTVGERLGTLWAEQRDLGSRGQVRMLLEALELADRVPIDGPVMDALDEAYRLPILAALPVANAGAREVLEAFSRRGLRLALICNTGRTPGSMLRLVLDRLGLKAYLRVLTFSDEVGLRKPHPEIFRRTLAALGVPPSEAAHVGDDATTDVAGARGVGMQAIHLCHPASASKHSAGAPSISELADLSAALFGIAR